MSSSLGLKQGTLILRPYDAAWATAFDASETEIRNGLGRGLCEIEHIGSTAVTGLLAKPILDIGLRADIVDHERIAAFLIALGYIDRGLRSGRLFVLLRDGDIRTHNLHLYGLEDAEWDRHIAFRDRLRNEPLLRDAYGKLKQDIIRRTDGRRIGYADAKGPFIAQALED